MKRARLLTVVVSDPPLFERLTALAEGLGLEVIDGDADLAGRRASLVVRELARTRKPVGLDEVAAVQALASEAGNALLIVVAPVGTDAYVRSAMRRAGAFEVVLHGSDLEDEFSGLTHVARRISRLELERERLVGELAHRERLSTVGLLAAGVSHEINNPSAAILMNAETVRADIEQVLSLPRFQQGAAFQERAGEWLEALGDTIGASRRISSIVRSLNVFSRRTNDDTAPVATNLNTEIQTVLRLVGKEVRMQAGVDLELGADLPDVNAPPFALTQIVSNLVVNALQALDAATAAPANRRLHIETATDGESVLLQVSDNGNGIPPEVIGRVFDPFFTTKPVGSGTGLGLSITRELVHRCGGEVFVESDVGHGTTFRVVLPIAPPTADAVRPMSQAPAPLLRHRVLVVDDDAALLRALTRSLGNHFECVAETSGEAALARVRDGEHFDAALLDMVMPGLDGLDTWRSLGLIKPELARRTVFFSGGVRAGERAALLEATGQPLLPKPVEVAQILAALRTITNPPSAAPGRGVPALTVLPSVEETPDATLGVAPRRRSKS